MAGGFRRVGLVALLLGILGAFPGHLHAQLPVWSEVNSINTSNQYSFYTTLSAVGSNGDVVIAGTFQGSVTFGTLPALTASTFSDVFIAKMDGRTKQWLWAVKGGGDGSNSNARVKLHKLVIDGAGDVVISGQYTIVAAFGNLPVLRGGGDAFHEHAMVAKVAASNGNWLWATGSSGPGSGYAVAHSLAVDASGNVTVGGYRPSNEIFGNLPAAPGGSYVARISAGTGQWQWLKQIDTNVNATGTTGVASDAAGNVTVSGYYSQPLTLGTLPTLPASSLQNIYVAKLNPATGQWLWGAHVAGNNSSSAMTYAASLACSPTGDVVVTGYVPAGSFRFGSLPAVAGPAAWQAKLDGTSGTWQWVNPAPTINVYSTVAFDNAGDVIAAGSFTNTAQFGPSILLSSRGSLNSFVSKTNFASGQTVWATRAGSFSGSTIFGIQPVQQVIQASSGDILLTGNFEEYIAFGALPTLSVGRSAVGGPSTYLARLSLGQFALTDFTPSRNATSAAVAAPVTAVYSRPVAASAATALRVFGDQRQGHKSGVHSQQSAGGIANNVLQFTPAQPFSPDELVSVSVASAAASGGSLQLAPWVYQFRAAVGGPGRGLFTGTTEIAGSWQSAFVTKGDLDNDGDLDIISAGPQGTGFTIGLNDGNGSFAAGAGFSARGTVTAIALADVDADGDLDLTWAAHYPSADSVLVRFNTGNGFGGLSKVAVGSNPRSLAFGDLDADGDLDLVVASYQTTGSVSVRLNNGTGLFSGIGAVSTGTSTHGAALSDIDNDGDLDLLATNEGDGTLAVALNNGTGGFGAVATVPAGVQPHDIAVADIDMDGDLDVLVSSAQVSGTTLAIGRNNGAGRFATSFFPVGSVTGFALVDVDADRDFDLIVLNQSQRIVRTWLNSGAGIFYGSQSNALIAIPNALATGDFDGDGDVDWVSANSTGTLSPRFNTGVALAAQPGTAFLAVSVYPNPAHQQFTISLPQVTTPVQLTLTNAVGQIIQAHHNIKPTSNGIPMDVSGIPPGLYYLHILAEGINVVKRVAVK